MTVYHTQPIGGAEYALMGFVCITPTLTGLYADWETARNAYPYHIEGEEVYLVYRLPREALAVRGQGPEDESRFGLRFSWHNKLIHTLPQGMRVKLEEHPRDPETELTLRLNDLGLLAIINPIPVNAAKTLAVNHQLVSDGKQKEEVFWQFERLVRENTGYVQDLIDIQTGIANGQI